MVLVTLIVAGLSIAQSLWLEPSAKVIGPVEVVYDWQKEHCHDGLFPWQWDVSDGPPRMFRNANETRLIAGSNLGSRANVGPDANHVKHTCDVYHNDSCGNQDPSFASFCPERHCCDPSLYQSREWIQSPVSFPQNNTVLALTHMEYHPNNGSRSMFGVGCDAPAYTMCWYNAIVAHVSHDGGRTWEYLRPPPEHLIASIPYRVPSRGAYTIGYEAPSGIVQSPKDGFYYVLVQTWQYKAQQSNATQWPGHAPRFNESGSCVLRTRNLFDPKSWRAWSGSTWEIAFIDPYSTNESNPSDHVCAPVLNIGYPSLVWSTYYGKFLVAGNQYWDCSDVVFSLSDDLISWSDTALLRPMNCTKGPPLYHEIYPSLIDPVSSSPSFDTVGESPFLYFATFHDNQEHEGYPVVVRGISRQQVRFAHNAFPLPGAFPSLSYLWPSADLMRVRPEVPWTALPMTLLLLPMLLLLRRMSHDGTGNQQSQFDAPTAEQQHSLLFLPVQAAADCG